MQKRSLLAIDGNEIALSLNFSFKRHVRMIDRTSAAVRIVLLLLVLAIVFTKNIKFTNKVAILQKLSAKTA